MGSSGGGGGVGYVQSPQQQQMFNWFSPMVGATAQYGQQNIPQPMGMRWIDPQSGGWTTPSYFERPQAAAPEYQFDLGRYTFNPYSVTGGPETATDMITGRTVSADRLREMYAGKSDYAQYARQHPERFPMLFSQQGVGATGAAPGTGGGAGAAPGSAGGFPTDLPLEYFSPFQPGLWPLPTYQTPSPEWMMPTGRTMGSISPAVWEGIMQPYQRVEQQLMETLGGQGGLGSARGGFSGQGAAGIGKYWAEAAPGIGMQAWNMISPALQQGWAAELQKQQALWGESLQQFKYPWQAAPSYTSMSMPQPYMQQPSQSSGMSGLGSFLGGVGSLLGAIPTGGASLAVNPALYQTIGAF